MILLSEEEMNRLKEEKNQNSIPKIIHYCWFGGKPIPSDLKMCMDSWDKLQGYKVVCWSESNCSFDENEFVRRTYQEKQLGFIGDYYRLKAVYEYGGIYLDTDVKINKSFDPLLKRPAFFNFIFDCSVGSAIIGAQKGNPIIKGLLDMYDNTVFAKNESGRPLEEHDGKYYVDGYITSNYYYTYYMLKHYPEFILNNRFQNMGDFVIFPKEYFEVGKLTGNHYAVHLCAGEWRDKDDQSESTKDRIKRNLKKFPALYDVIQIMVRQRRYRVMQRDIPFFNYAEAQKRKRELPEL